MNDRQECRCSLSQLDLELSPGSIESVQVGLRRVGHFGVGRIHRSAGIAHRLDFSAQGSDVLGQRQHGGTCLDVRDQLTHGAQPQVAAGDVFQGGTEAAPGNAQLFHLLLGVGRRCSQGVDGTLQGRGGLGGTDAGNG
ncbi:hypothetical protein D9M70_438160 [compost metagenome]